MKFVTDDFSLTLLGISAACRRAPPRFFSTACASSVWFFAAGRRKLGSSCADRRPAGTESNFHARSPRLINRPHAAPGFVQSIPRRRAALNPAGTSSPPDKLLRYILSPASWKGNCSREFIRRRDVWAYTWSRCTRWRKKIEQTANVGQETCPIFYKEVQRHE